ncbi:sensor domain-containing diguanylate cyclase [Thalassotalea euphylliae]|uniref:diguanylate cyclase n=1 Tax=Thalassotalea euphylliae TaxID=1655234 RepID=A0A3E0UEP1_9GAMM|nr:sensor domain-containing diguanylate cyclase [Thalassotalea euphylliae]REL35164.1 GGDEF domain-containing protein [Thalassotalea euphylliae]
MRLTKRFDRHVTLIFITTVIVLIITSYFTFNKVIRDHFNHQQQALVPLLSLATNEIIRPLTISHHIAKNHFINQVAQADTVNIEQLGSYLKGISDAYGLLAFVAFEKHNFMLDSDYKQAPLTSERAEWFHRLKGSEQEQIADIGNVENPHLYFDVKLRDAQGAFLGFAGVGVDLDHFSASFSTFRDKFGYELYVADQQHNITITSSSLMKTESHHRKDEIVNLTSLPWFEPFAAQEKQGRSSDMVEVNGSQYVISKIAIPELKWHLYLVAPPPYKQSTYWQQLVSTVFVFLLVILALYFAFEYKNTAFKHDLVKDSETDFLTKLPNRSFINWKAEDIRSKHRFLSVVIADIDKFKSINDQHGHLAGDEVLKVIATELSNSLRQFDVVARWGGEEFIIMLPDTGRKQAFEIAERARQTIASRQIRLDKQSPMVNVTLSFGLAEGDLNVESLNDIVKRADRALYQAKENGRNCVVIG